MTRRTQLVRLMVAAAFLTLVSSCGHQAGFSPIRMIVDRNDDLPRGFGAYGFVVLPSSADSSDSDYDYYTSICQSYFDNIFAQEAYREDYDREQLMPTFWLVRQHFKEDYNRSDCERLVDTYDYGRVDAKVRKIEDKSQVPNGPFLLAASGHPSVVDTSDTVLIVSLEGFRKEDVDKVFQVWIDKISKDPKVWEPGGFNLEIVRLKLRDFLEDYGDTVVQVTQITGSWS